MSPVFLEFDTVLRIHEASLRGFGGLAGVRSPELLESALGQPRATFGGEFLHEDLFQMAAAYLFHVVKNHPFVDGNKRVGLAVAMAFLDRNGHPIEKPDESLYDLTIAVAEGRLDKPAIAQTLRDLAGPTSPGASLSS